MIFHKFCIYVPKMHVKTHAELLCRYRRGFFFLNFHFSTFDNFLKLKLPNGYSSTILETGLQAWIILCLVTLELWLRDNNSFVVFLLRQKTNVTIFLKKLFHPSTPHTYHHNSSWFLSRHKNFYVFKPVWYYYLQLLNVYW